MTQKITIEPVTRIEGHAKVTIHMKDDGSVDQVYMHVNEFRGFETSVRNDFTLKCRRSRRVFAASVQLAITWRLPKPADALTGQTPPRPASLLRENSCTGEDCPEPWDAFLRVCCIRSVIRV